MTDEIFCESPLTNEVCCWASLNYASHNKHKNNTLKATVKNRHTERAGLVNFQKHYFRNHNYYSLLSSDKTKQHRICPEATLGFATVAPVLLCLIYVTISQSKDIKFTNIELYFFPHIPCKKSILQFTQMWNKGDKRECAIICGGL